MTPARQTAAARRPTLRDVARRAGVSTSTASLVFSGKGPVATATAERVRTAATDLAYAGPDPLASSLRQGRVGTVAVVVEGPLRYAFHDPFALAVLDGLAEELDAAGRSMLLVAQPVEDPERALAQLATQAVDARRLPAVRRARQPGASTTCWPAASPLVGQRRTGAPAGGPRAHRRGGRDAAHDPPRARARPHPGRPPVDAAAARARPHAAWVTEQRGGAAPPTRTPPGGSPGSARSPATTRPSCRRTTSPSRPGRPRPGCCSTCRPTGDRRPWSPRPTCSRPAWCAPRRPSGLRVPHDLSVTGFDGVDLPWLDHVLTTVEQPGRGQGPGDGAARAPGARGPPITDEPFPVRLRVGTTTSSPPSATR